VVRIDGAFLRPNILRRARVGVRVAGHASDRAYSWIAHGLLATVAVIGLVGEALDR
jgi:hypothetical protein